MFKMIEVKGGGDCYECHARYIVDELLFHNNKDLVLVHGIVKGSDGTEVEGIRFGHCWLENGSEVWDQSNGRDLHIPTQLYYILGHIKKQDTYRYTPEQVKNWINKTGHWGPWELKSER